MSKNAPNAVHLIINIAYISPILMRITCNATYQNLFLGANSQAVNAHPIHPDTAAPKLGILMNHVLGQQLFLRKHADCHQCGNSSHVLRKGIYENVSFL